MGKKQLTAKIISQTKLADGIYDMRLQAEEIAACAKPGQFISVYVNDKSKILPETGMPVVTSPVVTPPFDAMVTDSKMACVAP